MKREINPSETSRAQAFNYWMKSPMPMVTITKTFDVTIIYKLSKQKGSFNSITFKWTAERRRSFWRGCNRH